MDQALVDRLWAKVDRRGKRQCWPWQAASVDKVGAGMLNGPIVDGKKIMYRVPRLVFELEVGPIPAGHHVRQTCGNPGCCNPRHLVAVLPWSNEGRPESALGGECPHGHAFTDENTGWKKRERKRYCRRCRMLYERAKRQAA